MPLLDCLLLEKGGVGLGLLAAESLGDGGRKRKLMSLQGRGKYMSPSYKQSCSAKRGSWALVQRLSFSGHVLSWHPQAILSVSAATFS